MDIHLRSNQAATTAMIDAIKKHQIVLFGEVHGNKQEYEWLCSLVKTPEFADCVDDIVVEFGNSLYQKTVDRYIAGEDVPQEQVEKAWRNMVGAVGLVSPVYEWFYKAVRDANIARRGKRPIRLLLGDPYGDWEKINDAEDIGPFLAHRDEWYTQVVKDEVLAKQHRALLIIGCGHCLRMEEPSFIEREIRASGVTPYLIVFGTNAVGEYNDLDQRFDEFYPPVIVSLKDSWVGNLPAIPVITGGTGNFVLNDSLKMADVADAMLYVGSRDTLTHVNVPKAVFNDTAYRKELNRRMMIQIGYSLEFKDLEEELLYSKPLEVSNIPSPPTPPKSINDPLPPRPPSQ